LHLTGFADLVEERAGMLVPIEYKHGEPRDWPGNQIQLCLAERLPDKPPIPYGYIYYVSSRRRVRVSFTAHLRTQTQEASVQALRVAAQAAVPSPLSGHLVARCPKCSLLPLCMPGEVRLLQAQPRRSLKTS
jgi:CRISPR/Cas system-associated exonuclease Cas4 (RecB family)